MLAAAALPPPKAEPDCEVCGKRATKACTNCLNTHYCCKECQVQDWPKHKKPCKELAAALKKKIAEEEEARSKAARVAVTNPPCAFCGKASFETCTNCMATHYCSKACQVKHWPVHKLPCKSSPIYTKSQEVVAPKKNLAEQEQTLGVDHEETLRTVN